VGREGKKKIDIRLGRKNIRVVCNFGAYLFIVWEPTRERELLLWWYNGEKLPNIIACW
jgi:hypothetical protein